MLTVYCATNSASTIFRIPSPLVSPFIAPAGFDIGVGEAVEEGAGVAVGVGDAVAVGVGEAVEEGVGVAAGVGDTIAVGVGEAVEEGVGVAAGVGDIVAVGVGDAVVEGVDVAVGVGNTVAVGVGEAVAVGNGVGVGVGKLDTAVTVPLFTVKGILVSFEPARITLDRLRVVVSPGITVLFRKKVITVNVPVALTPLCAPNLVSAYCIFPRVLLMLFVITHVAAPS